MVDSLVKSAISHKEIERGKKKRKNVEEYATGGIERGGMSGEA